MGQVDYDATPDELQSHFEACGTINRVTILCDKFSGRPKGYAYIEFADKDGAENALSLEGSPFKGRTLKVRRTFVSSSFFSLFCYTLFVRGFCSGDGGGAGFVFAAHITAWVSHSERTVSVWMLCLHVGVVAAVLLP